MDTDLGSGQGIGAASPDHGPLPAPDVYFCDAHSPWQRGSNENTNGLLRDYFPKRTDLSTISPTELQRVADELNNRPRKTLNWSLRCAALITDVATKTA